VRVLDRGQELCAIVTVHVEGWSGDALVTTLRAEGIHTSAVTRASAVLDLDDKGVESVLRISPHYYNSHDEVDALLDAVVRHARPG
jgi:selenocysteine lyase/cysteine desulfurase